jgi:hypothetical protein
LRPPRYEYPERRRFLDVGTGFHGFGDVVYFASDLRSVIGPLNAAVEALNRDVTAQLLAPGKEIAWVNSWRRWRATWRAFYDKWWPQVADPVLKGALVFGVKAAVSEALEHRKAYDAWLADFSTKKGGKITTPTAKPPKPKVTEPGGLKLPDLGAAAKGLGAGLKWAGIGLALVAGLFVLGPGRKKGAA